MEKIKLYFKKISKVIVVIIVTLIISILIYALIIFINPLSHSEESIREYVLKRVPEGTNITEFHKIINRKKWDIMYENDYGAFLDETTGKFDAYQSFDKSLVKIGCKNIRVHIGTFYAPFQTDVTAFFVFDENDCLITVIIQRDIDAF